MSRHRAIRNLDLDDLLDDDDVVDDAEEISREDQDRLDQGREELQEKLQSLGLDNVPEEEIQETLWYYYFDQEKALDWILQSKAKSAAAAAKSKKKKGTALNDDARKAFDGPSPDDQVAAAQSAAKSGTSTPGGYEPAESSGSGKATPRKKLTLEDVRAMTSGAGKVNLNMLVIGHVDAGKSTLMGRLLLEAGRISAKTHADHTRQSEKVGKSSFALAWAMDDTAEERERGVTIDVATDSFETAKRRVTVLDAPGHRDFIPNMIGGATQADVALLVIDATPGEFESGFQNGGQTREHALVVRSLGVQQLIVAVNKLDKVPLETQPTRYAEIKEVLEKFLIVGGYQSSDLHFVPCSGFRGDNVWQASEMSWYRGASLAGEIDALRDTARDLDGPTRITINNYFRGQSAAASGLSVMGRLESGFIQTGDQLSLTPGGEVGTVRSIMVGDAIKNFAIAGDTALISFGAFEPLAICQGGLLHTPGTSIPMVSIFRATIKVFSPNVPITLGSPLEVHTHGMSESGMVKSLVAVVDPATGQIIKKNPRILTGGTTASIQVQLSERQIPMTLFSDCKPYGRVVLRRHGESIGAGIVTATE